MTDWTGLSITHRWPMDDANVSGTTIVDVVSALNGTAGSSVSSATGPFIPQARSSPDDANGYITLATKPIADLTSSFSIACWAYRTNFSNTFQGAGTAPRLLNFYDGSHTINVAVDTTDNAASLAGAAGTCAFAIDNVYPTGSSWTTAMSTSTWAHIALTYNGSSYVVYFNGSAQPTLTDTSGVTGANSSAFGGRGANDRPWGGRMYQLVTANAAWTDTQVLQIYNNDAMPTPVIEATLIPQVWM